MAANGKDMFDYAFDQIVVGADNFFDLGHYFVIPAGGDIKQAIAFCDRTPTPLTNTLKAGLVQVLNKRSDSKSIHIVRHPGGVLQSWRKRYLANKNHAKVLKANVARLKAIVDLHPKWAKYFGDLSKMSVEEAEMWFWRYSILKGHTKTS